MAFDRHYSRSASMPVEAAESFLPRSKSLVWHQKEPPEQSVYAWDWKSGIAFSASVFAMQGSLLFLIGSVAMYKPWPAMAGNAYRAWVDYPFMFGAWCFLFSNYFVYFNAINSSHAGHDKYLPEEHKSKGEHKTKLRFMAFPSTEGEVASAFSNVGAVLFIFNTGSMFVDKKSSGIFGADSFTVWYVATGSLAGVLFTVSAILEGEYNGWRRLSMETLHKVPVWQAVFNLFGGLTYTFAYLSDYDHYGENGNSREDALIMTPFTIGSACYLVSSFLDAIMWKKQNFGLGFAKVLDSRTDRSFGHTDNPLQPSGVVCFRQMLLLLVYVSIICMAYCRVGQVAAGCRLDTDTAIILLHCLRVFVTYYTILVLMTVLHRTPDQPPYNYLLWLMRFAAVLDMFVQFDELRKRFGEIDA